MRTLANNQQLPYFRSPERDVGASREGDDDDDDDDDEDDDDDDEDDDDADENPCQQSTIAVLPGRTCSVALSGMLWGPAGKTTTASKGRDADDGNGADDGHGRRTRTTDTDDGHGRRTRTTDSHGRRWRLLLGKQAKACTHSPMKK
jgi:hypothetical protein